MILQASKVRLGKKFKLPAFKTYGLGTLCPSTHLFYGHFWPYFFLEAFFEFRNGSLLTGFYLAIELKIKVNHSPFYSLSIAFNRCHEYELYTY